MTQTQMADKQVLDNFDLIGTEKYIRTSSDSELERLYNLLINRHKTSLEIENDA